MQTWSFLVHELIDFSHKIDILKLIKHSSENKNIINNTFVGGII